MGSNPIRNKHGQSKFIRSGGLVALSRRFDPPILPGFVLGPPVFREHQGPRNDSAGDPAEETDDDELDQDEDDTRQV
jgi:hypothetical protein